MNEEKWIEWEMHTSKVWSDLRDVLKPINVSFIDYDHKVLVEYALKLNKVIDKLDVDFSLELLHESDEIMHGLYDYAVAHFSREEAFMTQYKLPETAKHKREHSRILIMLKNSIDDFDKGRVNVGQKLKFEVTDWLIGHINNVDYKFFNIDNWSQNLVDASDWDQVKDIINLTGISDIDEQHRIFTSMAIEVMENISANKEPQFIVSEFERFREYAMFHFDYEQKFMEKYKVKETYDHHDLHDYFIRELSDFPEQIIRDDSKIDDLKSWILKWWINHINTIDRETFKYKNWAYALIDNAKSIDDVRFLLRLTGIEAIDNDHIHLMEETLKLHGIVEEYLSKGRDSSTDDAISEIGPLVDEICKIAEEHFEREQKIMLENDLEDTRRHIEEHKRIIERFKKMRENYMSGRLKLSKNIKKTILEWWIEHTNTVDYVTFVRHFKHEDGFTKMRGEILDNGYENGERQL
jgi:hemerythrin